MSFFQADIVFEYIASSVQQKLWSKVTLVSVGLLAARIVIIVLQSKLFITSLFITEYLILDIKLPGTDLFPLKFPLYNRIFT